MDKEIAYYLKLSVRNVFADASPFSTWTQIGWLMMEVERSNAL